MRVGEHNIFDNDYDERQIERVITHPGDDHEGVVVYIQYCIVIIVIEHTKTGQFIHYM